MSADDIARLRRLERRLGIHHDRAPANEAELDARVAAVVAIVRERLALMRAH